MVIFFKCAPIRFKYLAYSATEAVLFSLPISYDVARYVFVSGQNILSRNRDSMIDVKGSKAAVLSILCGIGDNPKGEDAFFALNSITTSSSCLSFFRLLLSS